MSTPLQVTFSGPSSAANSLTQVGTSTSYHGGYPDFTSVGVSIESGTYEIRVLNYHGVTGWPLTIQFKKSDGNLTNVLGTYDQVGGTGTAVVAP